MDEIMIYSTVTVVLLVAASAVLSFYSIRVMTKAPATLLISKRRRRRTQVSQPVEQPCGHPYRTPGRIDDPVEKLNQVAEAAAVYVGFKVSRSWLNDLSAERVFTWVRRNLWRIAVDAAIIGLVLPLLPGVQFTGTASTAVELAVLHSLCLVGCGLLLALIFMLVKVCSNTPLAVPGFLALLVGLLATPWAALKAVDLFADSFNMSGVLGTILAGLVMAVVRSLSGGSKKESKDLQG